MHTPLHIACFFDQTRIVQELLRCINEDGLINGKDKVEATLVMMMIIDVIVFTVWLVGSTSCS